MVESAARASSSEQGGGGDGGGGSGGGGGLLLPPGFRFHPTNEEIITSYLLPKFINPSFVSHAVGEVDLNSCEPRDLPGKATMGEKEWYFFVHKDLKYPTGMRANRATREGYWKATGKDREILSAAAGELVGMKKTLVFYTGRAPHGGKTNWVMHEFRLDGKSRDQTNNNPKDEWVVCKVFNKKGEGKVPTNAAVDNNAEYSAGRTTTNNASSAVDAGDVVGDFLDSMLDPLYFAEYSNSLPAANTTAATTTDANVTAPPPFNEDDYYNYTVPTTAGTGGSFNVMPYYNLTNTASNTQLAAAPMTSSVPTSSGGGGSYMLNPAAHGMGRSSYNVNLHRQDDHQQALMVKALEGVIGRAPDYGVLAKAPAIARTIPQQQSKLGSYDDGGYAYGNYDLADGAAVAMDGRPAPSASAKNFGGRLLMDQLER